MTGKLVEHVKDTTMLPKSFGLLPQSVKSEWHDLGEASSLRLSDLRAATTILLAMVFSMECPIVPEQATVFLE